MLLLLKCCGGLKYALLGHPMGLWVRELHPSINYVTFFGAVFLLPYSLKPLFYLWTQRFLTSLVIKSLFFQEYGLLFLMTLVSPQGLTFPFLAFTAASLGALLDVLLTVQLRKQSGGIRKLSFGWYSAEFLGMIAGSNGAFFMSQFFSWPRVYQILISLSFFLSLPHLKYFVVKEEAPSLSVSFGLIKKWLLFFTLASRLQSALLSQTPQLFFLEQESDCNTISLAKAFSYLGTAMGILMARFYSGGLAFALWCKLVAACGFTLLAHFSLLEKNELLFASLTMILERLARGFENVVIMELHMRHSGFAQSGMQLSLLSSLGQISRTGGEMISGSLVRLLGWEGFFLFAGFCNLPLLLLRRIL